MRAICYAVVFLLTSLAWPSSAQNLIPNSGFEEYISCPGYYSRNVVEFKTKDWTSASLGTPDHFHSCSNGEADVPHNWAGISEAYEGSGYAGIYLMVDGKNYREYLQCKLLSQLIKDSLYTVEFHYRLSSYSMFSIDRIGLCFSDSLVKIKHDKVIPRAPDIGVVEDSALTKETGLWQKAYQLYRAKGNEQFVVIGNFWTGEDTRSYAIRFMPMQQDMLREAAYYYIDNVKVELKFNPQRITATDLLPSFQTEAVDANVTYVLSNINFEFNSYKLSYASSEELDKLAQWMFDHPETYLQLAGHTDDVGGEKYNLLLSKNRAHAVAQYLITKGIAANRISSTGYGKRKPLLMGKSEAERAVNRRVEARFSGRVN